MAGPRARRAAERSRAGRQGQQLSSRWTSFYQSVLPTLWIGLGVVGAVALPRGELGDAALPLAAIWLILCVFFVWLAITLRKVALEGDVLVVSSRRETHRFAFHEVERVSGTILLNPELVFVRFRRPTPFGSRIAFIPRQRRFRLFSRHPLVARLQALVEQQQAPGLPPPLGKEASRSRPAMRAVAIGALILVVVFGALAGLITSVMRTAGPYAAALMRAATHPALIAELGEPIRPGWLVSGHVRVVEDSGTAELAIPLSGPRGEATLHARATLHDDEWTFEELRATLQDGRRLDLLAQDPAPAEPPGELL